MYHPFIIAVILGLSLLNWLFIRQLSSFFREINLQGVRIISNALEAIHVYVSETLAQIFNIFTSPAQTVLRIGGTFIMVHTFALKTTGTSAPGSSMAVHSDGSIAHHLI